MDALGTYERRGGAVDVRFERHYPRPVETVWAALTDPVRLADWMGPALVEPRVGGRYVLFTDRAPPMTGRILTWQPPRLLEYSWEIGQGDQPDCLVRWELTPAGDGTDLVLSHLNMGAPVMTQRLAGWHTFLERLDSRLAGQEPAAIAARYGELQAHYVGHYKLGDERVACAS